jgi:hypothetical protein
MRRRKLLGVLAGLAVVIAAGLIVLRPWGDRVTTANFSHIRPGMTRVKVDALLGGPPGDYATVRTVSANQPYEYVVNMAGGSTVSCSDWRDDSYLIRVTWDDGGAVSGVVWEPNKASGDGPLGNLRWRFERQWRRWFP